MAARSAVRDTDFAAYKKFYGQAKPRHLPHWKSAAIGPNEKQSDARYRSGGADFAKNIRKMQQRRFGIAPMMDGCD